MRSVLRGLTAVALLVGFYLLLLVILAALVAVDVEEIVRVANGSVSVTDGLRAIPVLLIITGAVGLAGYRAVTASAEDDLAGYGVQVDPAREPGLVARVAQLAAEVGTRAPEEIWIIGEVNAAVVEDARMLGLLPGRRRMLIGAPLLLTLSPAQFDAVLAHELGHYSNRDTRFTPVIGRGRRALRAALESAAKGQRVRRRRGGKLKTVNSVPGRQTLYRILSGYAKLFHLITQADARRAEYAADRYSAAVAGREAAASALASLPAIGLAHAFFLREFASCGLDLGLAPKPGEFYNGFEQLIAQPERRAEIERLRANPPERKQSKYDSHPPIPDRVAAIRALPEAEPVAQAAAALADGGTAVAILSERQALLAATAERMLVEAATGKRAVGWEELVTTVARAQDEQFAKVLADAATALAGRLGSLPVVLDLVDGGQLPALVGRLPQPRSNQSRGPQTPAQAPAQRAELFGRLVWASITLELERQGRVRRELSWTETETLVMGESGLREELVAQVKLLAEASAGTPSAGTPSADGAATARLRELLKLS